MNRLALLALLVLPASGQEPYLVKDVNPEPGPSDSHPEELSTLGGLWVTDGTAAGTRRIHERGVDVFNYPGMWTIFEGRLWYVALGAMWVTDGTEAGTGPLLDRDGEEIRSPLRFAALGDRLVFTAADVSGVYVLWESDGTPAGTFQILPPVRPGFELVRAGDRVFFPTLDLSTGYELWAVRPDAP